MLIVKATNSAEIQIENDKDVAFQLDHIIPNYFSKSSQKIFSGKNSAILLFSLANLI